MALRKMAVGMAIRRRAWSMYFPRFVGLYIFEHFAGSKQENVFLASEL